MSNPPPATPQTHALTAEQVDYFTTFGFLRLPGLFADQIDDLTQRFEHVMASGETVEQVMPLHFDEPRQGISGNFLERDPVLANLPTHPGVVAAANALAERPRYESSDGDLFFCDTSWHCDTYGAPLEEFHFKFLTYLDPLRADSGAPRVIPGSNHWQSGFAFDVRRELMEVDTMPRYGVDPTGIPHWTIDTDPGDVLVIAFRTLHATFNGFPRRRLMAMSFVDDATR